MIDIFGLYKPFRNHLRRFPLFESLEVIHANIQHLQFNQPIPRHIEQPRFELGIADKPHEWELELLAKELVVNCGVKADRSLVRWNSFSTTINMLRNLENEIYGRAPNAEKRVLHELFRIAHRQFHWQRPPNTASAARYFRIFKQPDLDEIIIQRFGIGITAIYTVGYALVGHFLRHMVFRAPAQVIIPGVTKADFEHFIAYYSIDLPNLRKEIANSQRFTEDFAYSYNPMRRYPLMRVDAMGAPALLAPIPTYLFRGFTDGIYYAIYDAKDFARAFGNSFQRYVGEVLSAAVGAQFEIVKETEYQVGKARKDSVDWIVNGEDADLFIECKTKRITLESKIAFSITEQIEKDIDALVGMVLQVYKTLADALDGHYPNWHRHADFIFPIIVTLEDWYLLSPEILSNVDERVRENFDALNMSKGLLDTYPYTIASIEDLEMAIQVMGIVGVKRFMIDKTTGDHRVWNLHAFSLNKYRNELGRIKKALFAIDLPALASRRP